MARQIVRWHPDPWAYDRHDPVIRREEEYGIARLIAEREGKTHLEVLIERRKARRQREVGRWAGWLGLGGE